MAHQSGILASIDLSIFYGEAKEGHIRSFKVIISDESLKLSNSTKVSSSFENGIYIELLKDYDSAVIPYLDEYKPCYIMVRTDIKNSQDLYEWILISYTPDGALVRDKMTYASTRSSFKRSFGSNLIVDDIFCNKKSDVNYKGYQDHMKMKNAPMPLTEMETYALEAKDNEHAYVSVHQTDTNLPSITLQTNSDVTEAFNEFFDGKFNYIQIGVDLSNEKVLVLLKKNVLLHELDSLTPKDEPRFHFYNYSYSHGGSDLKSKIFIYSAPGFNCSVKHRMIYSTCKSSVIQSYEQGRDLLDKKVSICHYVSDRNR
ncbi:hypothetical protein HZS_3002, partial [Henneguya salminicola]